MRNVLIITKSTLQEAFARKNFMFFFGVSCLVLLIMSILFASVSTDSFLGSIHVNNGSDLDPLSHLVGFFRTLIILPLFGGGLFLSIFSVSSFIPNMLEKGNIDVLLSKPVGRDQIIWGKFFGGFLVVLFNVAFLVLGIWLLIGIKFGNWDTAFLMTIPTISFTFAVLYSLIILIGILSQSSILAMMLSYLIFFVFSPVLVVRDKIIELVGSKFLEVVLNGLYYIIPKTSELGSITTDLAKGGSIADYQPILSSFLFMILSLALSVIIFSKKDY